MAQIAGPFTYSGQNLVRPDDIAKPGGVVTRILQETSYARHILSSTEESSRAPAVGKLQACSIVSHRVGAPILCPRVQGRSKADCECG